jgi:hypothetical protein
MAGISTHVLDTSTGRPAEGVGVRLERLEHAELPPVGRPDPGAPDAEECDEWPEFRL